MTKGEVSILLGFDFGTRARRGYKLDELDTIDAEVVVSRPQELETIAPSFVQGFFGKSVLLLGRAGFYRRYRFIDWPAELMDQIESGLELALMERPLVERQRLAKAG